MTNEMSDEQLISYCEIHCKTPRALFSGSHVNRMAFLAGMIGEGETLFLPKQFVSLHEEMEDLCKKARLLLRNKEALEAGRSPDSLAKPIRLVASNGVYVPETS